MKRIFLLFFTISCFIANIYAQQFRPATSQEIYKNIKQLQNLTTVLYLAAHPDDENTRLLSFLAHEKNFNTIYLSLTRGDGGQNLIGTELGIELGLIRNYELIEARKIDGAHQAFSSFIDFGFTKNPEETFSIWNQQELVDEVKDAIKIYRPDLIICRFPTTGEGGHGQHTASAIVTEMAYDQLKNEKYPFLPERVLFNAFRFGDRNTLKDDQFKVITNQYNPMLGESYGEMAGRSRSIHRSQGAGTPQSFGVGFENFELMKGKPITNDWIDVDYSWIRVGAPHIQKKIENILNTFDFKEPQKSVSSLLAIRKDITTINDEYWKNKKLQEIDKIILQASGIMGEWTTQQPELLKNSTFNSTIKLISRYPGVKIHNIIWPGKVDVKIENTTLAVDSTWEQKLHLSLIGNLPITQPYWLANHPSFTNYLYDSFHTLPETPNQFVAKISLKFDDQIIDFDLPASYKYLSPTKGDVVQGIRIVPEMFVRTTESLKYYKSNESVTINIGIQSNIESNKNTSIVIFDIYNGKKNKLYESSILLPSIGKDSLYSIHIPADILQKRAGDSLLIGIEYNGILYDRTQRLIQYDHLPELVYYPECRIKLIENNWNTTNKKIGYIEGAGDKVFDQLKQLGVDIHMIPNDQLRNIQYLQQFDAIITGVRAYNTNESLVKAYDALMKYIYEGGHLIVQYNTSMQLLTDKIGPYPFTLGRDRVTDEKAPIKVLDNNHPQLKQPNLITNEDFDNWVQERGLYFASEISKEYKSLFEMNDKGESPLANAHFVANYGKGKFTYTAVSFFRQIPAGNRGAIKLFMNILDQ